MDLRREIELLINKASRESLTDTPNFILAEYLMDCLAAFEKATIGRAAWYRVREKLDNASKVGEAPEKE